MKAGIVGVYPAEGMPVAPAPIAIFKNAPHPNAAKLFVDFVLSRGGQDAAGARDLQRLFDAHRTFAAPPGQMPLAETKPLVPTGPRRLRKGRRTTFPEHFDRYLQELMTQRAGTMAGRAPLAPPRQP